MTVERLDWMLGGLAIGFLLSAMIMFFHMHQAEQNAVDLERLSRVREMCLSASGESSSQTCYEFQRYWQGRYPEKAR